MNEMVKIKPVGGRTTHFIGGAWSPTGGPTFRVTNPYNDELVAEVSAGGRPEAEAAVAAAHAAFPAWSATTPMERQRLFLRLADIIDSRLEETCRVLAVETGCSKTFGAFQVRWSSSLVRQAAGWGYLPYGDVMRSDTPGRFAMVTRKPLGVVAGFTPWNGAFNLAWRAIILPIVFGNTVVIKPSEEAPMSAGLLHAEMVEEAGFPPGVVNVVTHAPGAAAQIADVFFERREVRCINFTGSDKTARILGAKAGQTLKRTVMELGGYNPLLVLADADMDEAVNAAVFGTFFHQGQICMNTRKVIIERPIHDEFVERVAAKAQALKQGDPLNPSTLIGPLINDLALKSATDRVSDAVGRGARVVTGGVSEGRIYAPTVLTGVPHDAIMADQRHETFGPVLIVEAVGSAEEALARSQDTPYGLSAAIITRDQAKGLDMAQRFDAGVVHVNASTMAGEPSLPTTGFKDSGWGSSGHYAVHDFTELRLTTMTTGGARYPF